MADLTPGTWTVHLDGETGSMTITSIDVRGRVRGTFLGEPISGEWNPMQRKLSFTRGIRIYTGCLFMNDKRTLAGLSQTFTHNGEDVSGWYAQADE